MLTHLSIRDVVLVDKLDIDFTAGLCVLTGETGAGKIHRAGCAWVSRSAAARRHR